MSIMDTYYLLAMIPVIVIALCVYEVIRSSINYLR